MALLEKYLEKTPENERNKAAIAYLAGLDHIQESHPTIASTILKELKDQRSHLKLIASENYSSYATQLAMGNWMTDKYAEGYPQHRFYAGCDNVDAIEEAAIQELKAIFGCEAAFVQPHSGADANLIAMWAVLVHRFQTPEVEKLGKKTLDELTPAEYERIRQLMLRQRILGMSLNSGGHLTHGYRHNVSSKMMQAFHYDVDPKTEQIDYEALAKLAKEVKPTILLAGYSAHPRQLNFAKFREIADSVGAVLMADMAHFSGLVAGKVMTGDFDPIPHAHIVTSTTHKTLRGPRGGIVMSKQEFGDTINKACPLVMGGPLPHVMAAKAIAFKEARTPAFQNYARRIVDNAQAMAAHFLQKGMRLVTGGTENHLMILDLTSFGLTGRIAENALREAGLTVNRNAIPFDPSGPWYTSGIRLGTPALTTLGMGKREMEQIADWIVDILSHTQPAIVQKTGQPSKAQGVTDPSIRIKVQEGIAAMLQQFPLYPEIVLL